MDFDLGGLGKSFKALRVIDVKVLSMLRREASSVIEDDREATGLRGIENVLEGRRSNIGSDFDLMSAGAGRSNPAMLSSFSLISSLQKTGNSGNSLPGRYILNCSGLKVGALRTGDMRPDCTFLKSDGALIVGRRDVLRVDMKLILLRVLELVLHVEVPWDVKGRGSVESERFLLDGGCLLISYTGGKRDGGCSQQAFTLLLRPNLSASRSQ